MRESEAVQAPEGEERVPCEAPRSQQVQPHWKDVGMLSVASLGTMACTM